MWRGDQHRIDARLRPRAVRADALDMDVEERPARHHGAGPDREFADREPRMIVHAEHRVAREAAEQVVLEHRARAAQSFFGRLEDEVDRAVEVARLGEIARRAEQHRGVPVMAAGMHHARPGRLVRHLVRLEDRQRVHVGAQPDRDRPIALAQHADHAGPADAAMHLDAERLELLRHDVGGAVLGEPDLRMRMEVAPLRGQIGMVALDTIDRLHGPHLQRPEPSADGRERNPAANRSRVP